MHNIFEPFLAFLAISIAIAKVDPPETPVIIPSLCANSLAQKIPSFPETGINSSKYLLSIDSWSTNGMKSVVHPCMGCGFQSG